MEKTNEMLVGVLSAYYDAVLAKDVEAFLSLYTDDVQVFDTWAVWSYRGKNEWRAMVEGWFGSLGDEKVLADASEVVLLPGSDLSVIHAIMTFTAVSAKGEKLRWLQNRFTFVVKNIAGQMKIVHEHSSSPAEFGTMKVMLRKE